MFFGNLGQHMFIFLINLQCLGKNAGVCTVLSDNQLLLLPSVENPQNFIVFQSFPGLLLAHGNNLKPILVKAFQVFQKSLFFLAVCILVCDKSCPDILHGMFSYGPSQGKMKQSSQDQRKKHGPENIGFLPDIYQDLSFHDLKHFTSLLISQLFPCDLQEHIV